MYSNGFIKKLEKKISETENAVQHKNKTNKNSTNNLHVF